MSEAQSSSLKSLECYYSGTVQHLSLLLFDCIVSCVISLEESSPFCYLIFLYGADHHNVKANVFGTKMNLLFIDTVLL